MRTFEDNDYYGHSLIAARYCGFKVPPKPIDGLWVHGWIDPLMPDVTAANGVKDEDKKSLKLFVWNRRELAKARAAGFEKVTAIGSPFVYLTEPDFAERTRNLLVMPTHTIPTIEARYKTDDMIDYLNQIRSCFNSVTVCLYYADYPSLAPIFARAGYKVVCAGDVKDSKFLYKLYVFLRQSEFFLSNNVMTGVWYALYAGCKVFLQPINVMEIGQDGLKDNWYKVNPIVVDPTIKIHRGESLRAFFPHLIRDHTNPIKDVNLGARELGYAFKRRPEELKLLFGWNKSALFLSKVLSIIQGDKQRC